MAYSQTNITYLIKFLRAGEHPCGTDHTVIMRDVKTIKGVTNRLYNYHIPQDADFVEVWQVPCAGFYEERAYRLINAYPATMFRPMPLAA